MSLADASGHTDEFADLMANMLPVLFKRLYVTIKVRYCTRPDCDIGLAIRMHSSAIICDVI